MRETRAGEETEITRQKEEARKDKSRRASEGRGRPCHERDLGEHVAPGRRDGATGEVMAEGGKRAQQHWHTATQCLRPKLDLTIDPE